MDRHWCTNKDIDALGVVNPTSEGDGPEVSGTYRLDGEPRFVESLHNFLRERTFLEVDQVLFNVLCARSAYEDGISMFAFQHAMMRAPPQRNFRHGEVVLFAHRFDELESLEVGVIPVALSVVLHRLVRLCESLLCEW